jgi:hypothetical protein
MSDHHKGPGDAVDGMEVIGKLRTDLRQRESGSLAERTGARYYPENAGNGFFKLSFWKRELRVILPDFGITNFSTGEAVDGGTEAVVLYYFHKADGKEVSGKWISLAELPDGMFYRQAYQGYSGNVLSKEFGNDIEAFERSALTLGGNPETYGDQSFSFHVLPRLFLLAVYHYGDDEFPPSAQILFDESASHYLPVDICAFLGRMLALNLIKGK